jgi:hypothetical protein
LSSVLPAHDDLLTGDTLTSVTVNYRWRGLIVGVLENYLRQDNGDTSLDNQDLLSAFFEDFYSP